MYDRIFRFVLLVSSCILLLGAGEMPLAAQTTIPESERKALLEIYDQCGGANWAEGFNWRSGADPKNWLGVLIDGGHVVGIALDQVGLTGQLPESFFSAFPKLIMVSLANNFLSGSISPKFGEMTQLVVLILSHNNWTGELPDLNNLVHLKVLGLSDFTQRDANGNILCHVTGELPDLSRMPGLEIVDASFSDLTGSLPEDIGRCTELQVLELTGNKLTGKLPASIRECQALQVLSVQINQLSGEIPDLSTLTLLGKPLEFEPGRLYLSDNQFTGPFPVSILNLPNLTRFACSNNQLSGELPEDFRGMLRLEACFIDGNQFTGPLPKYLGDGLWHFNCANNKLTGTIPKEWEGAKSLGKVLLHNNDLSGEIPPIYKKLKEMDLLDIHGCRFSFSDLKQWLPFIKDNDCIFRFGMQQAYTQLRRESVASGSSVTFDATYPGSLTGDEHYRWYNMTTLQPVPDANEAKLQLNGVTKEQACRYVCLITSEKMGSSQPYGANPAGTLRNEGANDEGDIQPTLRSGFWELTVDGYFNGISAPASEDEAEHYKLYYRTDDQSLNLLCPAESIESMMIVSASGSIAAAYAAIGSLSLPLPLPSGQYAALINGRDGHCETVLFVVP